MTLMRIELPGLLSTFQDGGRRGFQKYGVQVGGPMDEWAHAVANILVGNAPDAAVLECTLTGPTLSFSENTMIALCGARMTVSVGGVSLPYDRAILLKRGTKLTFGSRLNGARTYLSVRGALDIAPVLGSQSTNLSASFGGYKGRALVAGDKVKFHPNDNRLPIENRMVQSGLPILLAPEMGVDTAPRNGVPIRFVRGSHWEAFNKKAQVDLVGSEFGMQANSNRQGLRLQGPCLHLCEKLELVSEVTVFGTVQVPPDGNPIVLMADRQNAGGYPKIATVAGIDLPLLAQRLPGEAVKFEQIDQERAEILWLERCRELSELSDRAEKILQQ